MSVVFFTDRDLGAQFPDILAAAGLSVERHRDHFEPTCTDEEWLSAVGKRGWVAVSHDRHIRYKPNELTAVIRHNVTVLVVIGRAPYSELARNFVNTATRITAFLARNRPPLIAKVYRPSPAELTHKPNAPGTVSRWYPE